MMSFGLLSNRRFIPAVLAIVALAASLALVACATEERVPGQVNFSTPVPRTAAPAAAPAPTTAPAPTAAPAAVATTAPAMSVESAGTLTVAMVKIGAPTGLPGK